MDPTQRARGAKNPWFMIPRGVPRPRARLLCFPYAGGSAAIYRAWADALPLDIELLAAQLPGRGTRFKDPPLTRMDRLIDALESNLGQILDRPFALFGHSMGGRVAFELTRRLRQRGGPMPIHLFVSGCPAPDVPDPGPLRHLLSDVEFIQEMRRYGGTPEDVLENPELLALRVPVLRADFELLETWKNTPEPPLSVPITAFGGREDVEVPEADLTAWREQTGARFAAHLIPGDHFFLHSAEQALVSLISAALATGPACS